MKFSFAEDDRIVNFNINENLFIIDDNIYLTNLYPEQCDSYVIIDNSLQSSGLGLKVICSNIELNNLPIINMSVEEFNNKQDILKVYGYYEFTDGWLPSYNNPDNNNFDIPAEPTGNIILNTKNNKVKFL